MNKKNQRKTKLSGTLSSSERVAGCLLGGAVGDALGAPVEFLSLEQIRSRNGPGGIAELDEAYGVRGAITDDTQMTLFTAEGLIRADNRGRAKGIFHPPTAVHHAYARWLFTQGGLLSGDAAAPRWDPAGFDGLLIDVGGLNATRAPGNTCIAALRSGRAGTIEEPLNDSKGCGGVMRAAPAGMVGDGIGHIASS